MRVGFLRATLHLGGVWAIAVAQPVLGLLGAEAGFFVARASAPVDLVLLAVVLGLLPPLVAGAAVGLLGRVNARAGLALHLTLVAALAGVLVLPTAGDVLGGSGLAVLLAAAIGAGVAAVYARVDGIRQVLTVLSPAPLIVVALFLFLSPAAEVLAGGSAGSDDGPAASRTPIVHVIFDELPVTTITDGKGRIDAKRFPAFASLARDGTWYRRATTVADVTLEAVPAQMSGMLPKDDTMPTTRDHPNSEFTLFRRSHDLLTVEPITDVCPPRLCREGTQPAKERLRSLADDVGVIARHVLLPEDLKRNLPSIDDNWGDFGGVTPARAPDREKLGSTLWEGFKRTDARAGFAQLVRDLRKPREKPPFVFMHSMLPHAPWQYLPDGRQYSTIGKDPPGLEDKAWTGRQDLADQGFQRHVLQARYADRLLGTLLDQLRASGLYDDAVIVVAADHGASFRANNKRRVLTAENVPDVAGVPLIVKYPGERQGRVEDTAVRTIDVVPTIADAAGVRLPWKADGMPARDRDAKPDQTIRIFREGEADHEQSFGDITAWQDERNAYEARMQGEGDFGVGPRPDLVGTTVPSGPTERPPSSVDGQVPALIGGRVPARDEATLAVAIGGRVVATTRTYPVGDGVVAFRAMLPPEQAGKPFAVFEVLDGDRLKRLRVI